MDGWMQSELGWANLRWDMHRALELLAEIREAGEGQGGGSEEPNVVALDRH